MTRTSAISWPHLMLLGLSGLEVARRLSALGRVPILMLTARGAEGDMLRGSEPSCAGAVSRRKTVLRTALHPHRPRRRLQAPAGHDTETAAGRTRRGMKLRRRIFLSHLAAVAVVLLVVSLAVRGVALRAVHQHMGGMRGD